MSKPRLPEAGGCEQLGLVLAWRACVRQTALLLFLSSKIWGLLCSQGHLYSSLVVQGGGERSVYFPRVGILGSSMT